MDRLHITHRNAVLASIVDNRPLDTVRPFFRDTSFDSLSRAFERVVTWQAQIIDITNELLSDRAGSVDQAIERALARTGELAGSDRTSVFRLRPPDRLDNTHEWVAPGIEPMIEQLQDLSGEMLGEWRPDFEAGRPVYLPDINALPDDYSIKGVLQMQGILSLLAVPMIQNGRLSGFVGYDAVRAPRSFLPVEIQLVHPSRCIAACSIELRRRYRQQRPFPGLYKNATVAKRRSQRCRTSCWNSTMRAVANNSALAGAICQLFHTTTRLVACRKNSFRPTWQVSLET